MSYRLAVLSDLPYAFWPLDETTGTTTADLSGQGLTGTYASAPALGGPGLAKGVNSVTFGTTQRFAATIDGMFKQGNEDQAFAFEMWLKPTVPPSTSGRVIMGRTSTTGLVLTGQGLEFRAASTDGVTYEAFYTVTDWTKPLHVVCNYVGRNLSIIVNGEEGTSSDFNGKFSVATATFYVGGLATSYTPVVAISAPAVYRRALSIPTAVKHYDEGRAAQRPLDIAQNDAGTYYSLDDDSTDVIFRYSEDTREDFETGTTTNLIYTDDYITAPLNTAGTHDSDLQYVGGLTNIAGSRIDWDASYKVAVSISWDQGTTWTACTNHAEVPSMGANANLANKFFKLRKTFTADPAFSPLFDSLRVVVYGSKTSKADKGDSTLGVVGNPTYAEKAGTPMDMQTEMGAKLPIGTYFTIPPRAEGIRGIEMWFRRDADANQWSHIFDAGIASTPAQAALRFDPTNAVTSGGATFYINGVAKTPVAADFPIGRWVHILASFNTATTGEILLNSALHGRTETGPHSFAHVVTFGNTIDARTASVRYNMQRGLVTTTYVDTAAFTVKEVPAGIKGYSYPWSSVQSGIT